MSLLGQLFGDKEIGPREAESRLLHEDILLLDVRTPEEVREGYIAGATFLDCYAADFDTKLGLLSRDKTVIIYCHTGGRSSEVAWQMSRLGFPDVLNLRGGILAWQREGLPIVMPEHE